MKRRHVLGLVVLLFAWPVLGSESQPALRGEQVWNSERWKYSVAFPKDWSKPRTAGPGVLSPGLDVYSQSDHGASAAVFAYSYHPLRSFDKLIEEVLGGYRAKGANPTILETNNHSVAGLDYRTLVFRFGGDESFISYYTIVFTPKMELAVSQNTPERLYSRDKAAFVRIVDSLSFLAIGEVLPISTPNKWISKDWGYSIIFPKTWFRSEKDTSQGSGPVDVVCIAWWGSSIFVFAYPHNPRDSLDSVASGIMDSYRSRSEAFKIEGSRDYKKNGSTYRTIIFRWNPPGQAKHVGDYTVVMSKEVMLLISCESAADYYDIDKADYTDVVDSLSFQ
jgi:hypothetical protein